MAVKFSIKLLEEIDKPIKGKALFSVHTDSQTAPYTIVVWKSSFAVGFPGTRKHYGK